MKRLPTLATLALACTTATMSATAQGHPSLTPLLDAMPDEVGFNLGQPTGQRHVMLACYVYIVGDVENLSTLIKKSLGAVSSYESANTSQSPFAVPGAIVDTPSQQKYTVPPSVIAHALDEIEWTASSPPVPLDGYALPFDDEILWSITAGDKALPWNSFETAAGVFDTEGLIRACLARQIAYIHSTTPNDPEVQTQVEAVIQACSFDNQTLAINVVAVEIQGGGPTVPPTPISIKLSRNVRITVQLTAGGMNPNATRFYHWNYVFPVHEGSTLAVPLAGAPLTGGPYDFFLPTLQGYVAVPATLYSAVIPGTTTLEHWLEATVPANVVSDEFVAWNPLTSELIPLEGLRNWTFYAPYPVSFVSFPLPPL